MAKNAKKNGLFINGISEALIHANTKKDGTGDFYNVSIPCEKSKTGWASITVATGQVLDSTWNGKVNEGYKNVLLGKAETARPVSVATNKAGSRYKTIQMTNQEIADAYKTAKATYKAAQEPATEE